MKAHIFLIANPKFQLQILCSFGDITKSVKLIGIPENNFLCIFIIASSPGVHTFFCLWRVNKKLPQGETSQNAFQRSRSINQKWKICMLEWAYPPLKGQAEGWFFFFSKLSSLFYLTNHHSRDVLIQNVSQNGQAVWSLWSVIFTLLLPMLTLNHLPSIIMNIIIIQRNGLIFS